MTEKSYFYDHGSGGDASYSPYNRVEFNAFMNARSVGDETGAFVIPDYLNSLKVITGGNKVSSVTVSTGAAFINGILYETDTPVSFNVARSQIYARIEYVVLRVDYLAQTARLAYLESGESSLVNPPVVTQVAGVLWEEIIAAVYVNPSTAYVDISEIYDRRQFLETSLTKERYSSKNLLKNSEFMAFSGRGIATAAPEHWSYGSVGTLVVGNPISPSIRGRSIQLTSETLSQLVKVNPACKTYSIKGVYSTTGGNTVINITGIRSDGTTASKSIQQSIPYVISGDLNRTFLDTVTFDEDDIEQLYIFISQNGGSNSNIGQFILTEGYHPGPYRQIHETIMFNRVVTDAAWTATAKSTGTTTISLLASFGATTILPKTRSIILRLRGRDSASAANNTLYLRAYGVVTAVVCGDLRVGGIVNDKFLDMQCIVPVDQDLYTTSASTPRFRLEVSASGALTFDATAEIVGIIT